MRNEKEIYELILNVAKDDQRIIAVYMNGSRTNEHADKDIFQDYDIVYVVDETESFIKDKEWLKHFGNVMYMQYPDENPNYRSDKANMYGWLVQFDDGVRMDIHVETFIHAKNNILKDKLCRILLDKNHGLPEIKKATDEQYWIKMPSQEQYHACCNEFWWCSNNIAKGLWREEIPYVQDITNYVVRKQLEKMLSWKVGVKTDFRVSVGKSAKYMYRWLTSEEYDRYLSTYFDSDICKAWKAIEVMCDLFEETARWVSEQIGYQYNEKEANAARKFLTHVRDLPKDAAEIY